MKSTFLGICVLAFQSVLAGDASRINDVEQLVRELNGKYEELLHKISVLSEQNKALEKRITNMQQPQPVKSEDTLPAKTGKQIVKEAEDLIAAKKYNTAIELLSNFLTDSGKDIYRGQGFYYLGVAYEAKLQYKKASVAYMKSHKENPEGSKSADALYRLAMCQKHMKQYDKAKVVLKKLLSLFPDKKSMHKMVEKELKAMA